MGERRLSLRSTFTQTLGDEELSGREYFDGGLLPTERQVIEMMIWVMAPRKGKKQTSMVEAATVVAEALKEHWIWSNVYPKYLVNIKNQVEKLFLEFKKLKSTAKVKQTDTWKTGKLGPFLAKIKRGMDIGTEDAKYLAKQEIDYGVKMTEGDRIYKDDQVSGERRMYCENFADKRWLATVERRRREEERLATGRERDQAHQDALFTKVALPDDIEDLELQELDTEEKSFEVEDKSEEVITTASKKRRMSGEKQKMSLSFADMPKNCQHISHSVKNVRDEYYTTVDELMSVYHMSLEQAISAVITVGKRMFSLDWRRFEEGEEITIDTVPDKKMNRKMGKALEAFTLSHIVESMLEQEEETTVTYHDDGSRSKGAGGYSVQGLTIQGKFFPLPTLAITSETRQNLADLKLTVLQLLSVTSGVSVEALWERIDFVMGDGTAHNMGVEKIVAEKLEVEHLPGHLLCQVHPALMFSRELVAVWKELDTVIGPEKIFAHFAVSLSDQQDSITEQWISCLLRLVTHDFDHKAWNKADEFDIFIHPDINPAKRLIKERFNSLVYSCAVTLALDSKVTAFLEKYTNVTNSLACIVRSFETVEYLRTGCQKKCNFGCFFYYKETRKTQFSRKRQGGLYHYVRVYIKLFFKLGGITVK